MMNHVSRFTVLIVTLVLFGLAPLGKAQSTSGLVAYYPFDGNANDFSGNGRTGTEYNGISYVPGIKGQAANFNGINAYVKASSDGLPTAERTVSLWFYANTIKMPRPVLLGYGGGNGCGTSWFMMLDPTPAPPFYISGHCHYYDIWAPYSQEPIGAWYHLAVTTSPEGTKFFVNGQLMATNPYFVNNTAVLPGRDLTIGVDVWYQGLGPYTDSNVGYFDGKMDELRIYNRALSTDEILQLYHEGTSGLTIQPTIGGNTGNVSVHVDGSGFIAGASLTLTRPGYADIVANNVVVGGDGTTMDGVFDLTDEPVGEWNVVAGNPGGPAFTLENGFTIEPGHPSQLWVGIVGLPVIRPGVAQDYWISYGTTGNVDIPASDLVLALPGNVEFSVDAPVFQGPNPPPAQVVGASTEIRLLHLTLPKVGPFSSELLKINLKAPVGSGAPFRIRALAYAAPTLAPAPTGPAITGAGRITKIAVRFPIHRPGVRDDGHVGFVTPDGRVFQWEGGPNPADVYHDSISESTYNPNELPYVFEIPNLTDDQAKRLYDWAKAHIGTGYTYTREPGKLKDIDHNTGACDGFIEAGLEAVGYRGGEGLVDGWWENLFVPLWSNLSPQELYERLRQLSGNQSLPAWDTPTWMELVDTSEEDYLNLLGDLDLDDAAIEEAEIRFVSSFDPNDKTGVGSGVNHYFSGGQALQYSVLFENLATATAPAQEVVITDQLDMLSLDLSSFSFGPMSFGSHTVTPPPGRHSFATDVDLRPDKDLIVRLAAGLDPTTGLLTWRFTSIDPATNHVPTNPLIGFLPPNVNAPEGDGSVLYTVPAKSGLSTGSEIRNRASITFDANAPILTPEWLNTVDDSAPMSSVLQLPGVHSSTTFPVTWTGNDLGSGIRSFTVYASDNGQPFVPWQSQTTATSALYTGIAGHTYQFYSLARDFVGNVESAKSTAEATTTIATPQTIQCTGCYFLIGAVRATLAFNIISVGSASTFSYNYRTSAQTVQFVSTTISQISVNGNTVTFSGQGKLNGQSGYSFSVTAKDGGGVGSGLDTISIAITGPNTFSYSTNGTIAGGDIVVK